ncbi:MAG TPA: YfiR family protein [Steroidobacteraceae bacterium]|nr:YfiR family protein [Steroidobacteraceae bacterium]
MAALLSSTWATWVYAADEAHSQDAVEAAYLYRFVGYVEWPEESMANHPFTIAISGAPGLAQELRRLLPAHPIHGEIAQVREVTRVQELGGAQILYVGTGHLDFLRAFAASGNRATLVVTADEQGIEMGSVVNFVIVDKRVRFEVSLTAAERVGLKISSELLSVAIRVRGGRRQSDYFCVPFALTDESDSLCGVRQAHRFSFHERDHKLQSSTRAAEFIDVS